MTICAVLGVLSVRFLALLCSVIDLGPSIRVGFKEIRSYELSVFDIEGHLENLIFRCIREEV